MSGDDQVNATTLLQGSRMLFLTQDGNQSVGLNSYVDAPTNAVMGLVIFDELNDPPNQTRISINNQGITETFANGDPDLNVSWSNFYLLKEATQALRLPITANILVASDTIEANDNNLAKTRIASMSALPSVNTQLTLKADTGGVVWEEADLTQNGLTYIDATGITSTATWTDIITGSATPNLTAVLNAGNDAGAYSLLNVNDIQLTSINSTIYPPPNTASWDNTLTISNIANQNIDMNGNNILNCNNINTSTINNLSPTTLGLNWGDFTGSNAFANVPNQAYQVDAGGNNTSQYYDRFAVFNSATPCYTTINSAGMELLDVNSATTTYYGSNTISSNNATAFTITAGTSSSQPLNLNCSQLNINSIPYSPPRPVFYGSGSNGFSLGGGSWANQGAIYTFQTGLTANTAYIMSVNFIVWTNLFQNDSAMYVDFYNSATTYQPATYSQSRPVACIGNAGGTFSTGGTTSQFVFNDWVSFTTDSNSQLVMEFYLGSGSGWSGTFYWSMFANIISP